ncbi:MAG: hypothetical protein ACK41P_02310 [Asticcacaulis sp.]
MKRMSVSVAIIAALTAGVMSPNANPKIDPKAVAKGMAEVPAVLSEAGLTCEPVTALHLGTSTFKVEGKSVKGEIYEVACKSGIGYVINKKVERAPEYSNCLQLAIAAEKDNKALTCKLTENANTMGWLSTHITSLGQTCTVQKANWLGTAATAKFDRYEVSCAEQKGYVVDVLLPGSTAKPNVIDCLAMSNTATACTLTPKATMVAGVAALAKKADAACEVTDVLWVGTLGKANNRLIEVACAGKPGFMIESTAKDEFIRSHDCIRAEAYGGCKLSDVSAVKKTAAEGYATIVKANKLSCDATDFRVIGTENSTNRDLVELKCSDKPTGLVGPFPQAASKAKFEYYDCLAVQRRGHKCSLTEDAALKSHLDMLIKANKKDCDVSAYRVIGASVNENGTVFEIACTNKRGYIAELITYQDKFLATIPCAESAKQGGDKCEIPGNGTYVSAVK